MADESTRPPAATNKIILRVAEADEGGNPVVPPGYVPIRGTDDGTVAYVREDEAAGTASFLTVFRHRGPWTFPGGAEG